MKKYFVHLAVMLLGIAGGYHASGQVTLFSGRNFTGTPRLLTDPGDYRITFDIRSMRITPGFIVVLPEGRCSGRCQYWRSVSGDVVIGAQTCGLQVIRADARDSYIEIYFASGGDDLRKGSTVSLNVITNTTGLSRNIGIAELSNGLGANAFRTVRVPVSGIRIDQILNLTIQYESGSSGVPFETTDNWDLKELIVLYRSNSYPDGLLLFNQSRGLVKRFTGSSKRFSIPVRGSVCNDIVFEL